MAANTPVLASGLLYVLGVTALIGCGGDAGPSDTTNSVTIDAVTTPTNLPTQVIGGTTDPSSTVTVTTATDTAIGTTNTQGTFGLSITLAQNTNNAVSVESIDPAGNLATASTSILHDNTSPTVTIGQPSAVTPTTGQSGFDIDVNYSDTGGSGIDVAAGVVTIINNNDIGGVFKQDGTFSTTISTGTDLAVPLFSVGSSQATYTVADTFIFPSGGTLINASVIDLAGNEASTTRVFTVGPDTTTLIVVNSMGAAGGSVDVDIGLANSVIVAGVQFDLVFDALVVDSVVSATPISRASSFSSAPFNQIGAGVVRVLLFDGGGDTLAPGQGVVLRLNLEILSGAAAGASTLTLQSVVISNPGGGTTLAPDATGTLVVQ